MDGHEALAGYMERVTALVNAWSTVAHPPAQISTEWRRLQSWHLLAKDQVPEPPADWFRPPPDSAHR